VEAEESSPKMKESKQYQFPKFYRHAENGCAIIKTWVGETEYANRQRVSPRIADETKEQVLDRMEADLKRHIEAQLQPA